MQKFHLKTVRKTGRNEKQFFSTVNISAVFTNENIQKDRDSKLKFTWYYFRYREVSSDLRKAI